MKYNYKKKNCVECGKKFNPTGAKQKCCLDKCKKEYEKKYNREYAQKYRKTEKGIEKTRKIANKYYLKNKRKILDKQRKTYNENKKKFLQKRKEYREQNSGKVKESKRVSYQKHIIKNNEKGRIYNKNPERKKKNSIRGLTRTYYSHKKNKCEECDETENLEFHHEEPYNKDKFKILCKKHHLEEHNKIKMENIFN